MLNIENLTLYKDEKKTLVCPGSHEKTVDFCIQHFINAYEQALIHHGAFYLALSGGSTPKTLFQMLTHPPYREKIDWSKIHLFWSDERSVSPDHPDSNYKMAMDAGFSLVPQCNIHRMAAENSIEYNALDYQSRIKNTLKHHSFDYIMLGMGDDGHTASLFPFTKALEEKESLVVANYIPDKATWRMTLTYPCINQASTIVIYILGASKGTILNKVLQEKKNYTLYPVLGIGSAKSKALWIIDEAAALGLQNKI